MSACELSLATLSDPNQLDKVIYTSVSAQSRSKLAIYIEVFVYKN